MVSRSTCPKGTDSIAPYLGTNEATKMEWTAERKHNSIISSVTQDGKQLTYFANIDTIRGAGCHWLFRSLGPGVYGLRGSAMVQNIYFSMQTHTIFRHDKW